MEITVEQENQSIIFLSVTCKVSSYFVEWPGAASWWCKSTPNGPTHFYCSCPFWPERASWVKKGYPTGRPKPSTRPGPTHSRSKSGTRLLLLVSARTVSVSTKCPPWPAGQPVLPTHACFPPHHHPSPPPAAATVLHPFRPSPLPPADIPVRLDLGSLLGELFGARY